MIRIAVVGHGFWGRNLARVVTENPRFQLVAVADTTQARLTEARRLYCDASLWDDPVRMLVREDLDAVIVTTPAATHHELGISALRQGCHVLMAKPFASNRRDAEHLWGCADAMGKVLLTDHTFVYHPAVTKLAELIGAGTLGDVWHVESTRTNLGTVRDDADVLWDLAVHDVSILTHLLGRVTEVSCVGADPLKTGRVSVASLSCWFASGALATVGVSWLSPQKVRRFLVCGSAQMAFWDDTQPAERLRVFDQTVTVDPDLARVSYRVGDCWLPRLDGAEALAVEVKHFADCIDGQAQPLTGPESACAVVRVLEAASESLLQGGRVTLA